MDERLKVDLVTFSMQRDAGHAGDDEWLTIRLLLENLTSEPLYIISEPRSVSYDAEARTLYMGFCEPAVNDKYPPRWFASPELIKLEPHSKNDITVSVSRKMTTALSSEKQLFERATVDLAGADQLVLQMRCSPSPFQSIVGHAMENARRLHDWGRSLDRSFKISKRYS